MQNITEPIVCESTNVQEVQGKWFTHNQKSFLLHNQRLLPIQDIHSPQKSGEGVFSMGRDGKCTPISLADTESTPLFGVLMEQDGRWHVYPSEGKEVEVNEKTLGSAKAYDLVEVVKRSDTYCVVRSIQEWEPPSLQDVAERYALTEKFPKKVIQQADACLRVDIPTRRVDLQNELTFTIDAADAQDLDDALSVTKTPDGEYILGVHIADVSHYVQEGTLLDREAYVRGNSNYFIDTSYPMLPSSLSNELCSLLPGQPRLTLSVIMRLSREGVVQSCEMKEAVISTHARLDYAEVEHLLNHPTTELQHALVNLQELVGKLQNRRKEKGALHFQQEESYIVLDASRSVKEVVRKERRLGHHMVEECMVLANEVLAAYATKHSLPLIYRSHKGPDSLALKRFNAYLEEQGHIQQFVESDEPGQYQQFLHTLPGELKKPVEFELLSSMSQAVYRPVSSGHFGLAAPYYCHFTAPIRRYADLHNHRVIKAHCAGTFHEEMGNRWEQQLSSMTKHLSAKERAAKKAESDFKRVREAEWLNAQRDQLYFATILQRQEERAVILLTNGIQGTTSLCNHRVGDVVAVQWVAVDERTLHSQFLYVGYIDTQRG